ncbi:sensor domain-containing protein [Aestuariibacter halophilus]|uniref:Sensor domain-containing protein n=1 Tax=Fluctibacter halophilus TaxID=226011 RepID=A0ABS8G7G2_9ALTE|nr:sensor domain-containing protein [Aestuariibacter halophilus]MCC2616061.1 sensor domain-containing protein [Aestuariibacter halophilus]
MTKHHVQIQAYLSELRTALQGQPAGLIQDAIYDAESHLLEGLSGDASAQIDSLIADYGKPADIAAQYIQMESEVQRFLHGKDVERPRFNGFFEPLFCVKDYKALGYFFVSLPLSVMYFAWAVLFGLPAVVLSVVVVGLPLLSLFLRSQSYLALIEGQLINTLLGVRMPRRPNQASGLGKVVRKPWETMLSTVKSPQGWKAAFYSVLHLPLSATYFALSCLLFIGSLAFIVTPVVDPIIHAFAPHLAIDIDWYWFPVTFLVGVIGMTLSMHITRVLVLLQSSIASYLLIKR